jgi:hypothetical protein
MVVLGSICLSLAVQVEAGSLDPSSRDARQPDCRAILREASDVVIRAGKDTRREPLLGAIARAQEQIGDFEGAIRTNKHIDSPPLTRIAFLKVRLQIGHGTPQEARRIAAEIEADFERFEALLEVVAAYAEQGDVHVAVDIASHYRAASEKQTEALKNALIRRIAIIQAKDGDVEGTAIAHFG